MGLVDDLQSALELAKDIVQNTEMANPIKVTYAVKLLAKEAAAGMSVCLTVCLSVCLSVSLSVCLSV